MLMGMIYAAVRRDIVNTSTQLVLSAAHPGSLSEIFDLRDDFLKELWQARVSARGRCYT